MCVVMVLHRDQCMGMVFDRDQCMGWHSIGINVWGRHLIGVNVWEWSPPEETRVRVRVFRISVYVRVVMVLHRDQCMG